MVFFTCNACGESLKKASVEKHYLTKCRACEVLSCIDCGKDFHGDDYKKHTSCISENEKYGGKNFKAAPQKGVVKQSSWMEIVRDASSDPSLKPAVRDALKRLVDAGYDNIPRKKAKFINFLGNSLRIRGDWLVNEIWDVIDGHATAQKKAASLANSEKNDKEELPSVNPGPQFVPEAEAVIPNGDVKKKKEKKKRKAEDSSGDQNGVADVSRRKRKRQGDPMFDDQDKKEVEEKEEVDQPKKKKKKKRKETIDEEPSLESRENQKTRESETREDDKSSRQLSKASRKKKKNREKKIREEEEEDVIEEEHLDTSGKDRLSKGAEEGSDGETGGAVNGEAQHQNPKTKFPWESVITEVLQGAGGEMRLKKLKKKVLTEFMSRGGDPSLPTDEKVMAKFNKKVLKNPKLKVYKEIVHLKS